MDIYEFANLFEEELRSLGFPFSDRMDIFEEYETKEEVRNFIDEWKKQNPGPYINSAQEIMFRAIEQGKLKKYNVR